MNYRFYFQNNQLMYSGDVPSSDSEGMEISLEKWREIVYYIEKTDRIPLCGGINTCGLCMIHYHSTEGCSGCVIGQDTGRNWCNGTPHEEWENLDDGDNPVVGIRAAKNMLEYLKRLKRDKNL